MFKNPGKIIHILGIILFGIWCTSKVVNIISPEKDNQNTVLVYYDSKFKIKCERRFEINPRGVVIGFSSKNCF